MARTVNEFLDGENHLNNLTSGKENTKMQRKLFTLRYLTLTISVFTTQYLYMRWIPFQTPPPFTFGGRAKFFQIFLTTKNTLKI